jgi:3-keto-disaccharide hydrolase
MAARRARSIVSVLVILFGFFGANGARAQSPANWAIHSTERPQPRIVNPGPAGPSAPPPADAMVLFNGRDLSRFRDDKGGPAKWKVENGYIEVMPGTGSLVTADGFGDVQLHIEWATPSKVEGEGQERGNSGVFFGGGRYEVQVLDSYNNITYPDGQAGAIFGQYPPLVNASRAPGEWQTYDIVFHTARFDAAGKLVRPARATVFHNNVLVQDDVELTGPTAFQRRPVYAAHPVELPITMQDHSFPVRFRNIWARRLD